MITENLSTLKIHKLTQAQYDRELANGTLDDNALYLTPDSSILDEEGTFYYDNLTNAFTDVTNETEEYAVGKSNTNVAKVTTHFDGTKIITVLSNTSASIACYSPFILDLNGKTVTLTDSYLILYSGGQIKNGSLSASGSGATFAMVTAYGDVVFDNVDFNAALSATGTLTGLLVNSGANVTLKDCDFEIKNTTKITNAIENNGTLNINNSTIKGLSPTAGQARGILSKAGKVTINDSYIYTDAAVGQSTAFLNVAVGTEAYLNNSTFFADARTNSNELSPDQYGRAIYNKGTVYADNIKVTGTCYGWSDFAEAVTYAQNSTIKSCGHGYYNHGTAYFVDCTFADADYDTTLGSRTEEEFTYATDDRQGRYAPIYVGDTNDTAKCDLHLDGCTIDTGSAHQSIVVHPANGTTHNIYLSNCTLIPSVVTPQTSIRLDSTTTTAYVGVGGNITTEFTSQPAQMVFTNELYRKKTPDSILNFKDFEALKNYMAQAILGGEW